MMKRATALVAAAILLGLVPGFGSSQVATAEVTRQIGQSDPAPGSSGGPRAISKPPVPEIPADANRSGHLERHARGEVQSRVDAARPGGLVLLEDGIYPGSVVINKPIRLITYGRAVVDGEGEGSVILVTAPGTTITGIWVRGSGPGPVNSPTGIRIEAADVRVEGVFVDDSYGGIAVMGAKRASLIGNVIRGRGKGQIVDEGHATGGEDEKATETGGVSARGDGIALWDAESVLLRNNLVEKARDGIYLSFAAEVLIDGNLVRESRYAVHSMFGHDITVAESWFERNLSGAVLMYTSSVFLLRSAAIENESPSTGFGILLKDVNGANITICVIARNRTGVHIEGHGSEPTNLTSNTIALNQVGLALYPSAEATISGNAFVENTLQVLAQGSAVGGKNAWIDRGVGNYWSNYKGFDRKGDDLGDSPHDQGGALSSLISQNPMLEAFSSGPAFRMLSAVEERWANHDPVAHDPKPMMKPVSPALDDGESLPSGSGLLAEGVIASLIFILGVIAMRSIYRPRSARSMSTARRKRGEGRDA